MTTTVAAMYDDRSTAERVVRELHEAGFTGNDISLVAREHREGMGTQTERAGDEGSAAATGAGVGAALGGLGGLLVGLGVLTIPGIGPVLAAGPLATALSGLVGAGVGAVAGGATGGMLGALVDMGVPKEEAEYYTEGVRRGGTLVTVRADDQMAMRAQEIMRRHDPVDMTQRVSYWREAGWQGYQPDAEPYNEEMARRDLEGYHEWSRERMGGARFAGPVDYDRYTTEFRSHYQSHYSNRPGYQYEHYEPAYRYGLTLGGDERYADYDWSQVEPEVRRAWEDRNPNTWEEFKDAVRYGWERVKRAVRD